MYSELVTDKEVRATEKSTGCKLKRRSVSDSIEISRKLDRLFGPKGLTRALTTDEKAFIRSETLLCRLDFRYFANRYGNIGHDSVVSGMAGSTVAPITFLAGQERTLELIAGREEVIHEQYAKHGFSDGILLVWHKCRQQGATALGRLICGHRMILYKNTRCFAASLDEAKVNELYIRDKIILDNLPRFLKPTIEFDVKNEHITLEGMKSRLLYQKANQQAGVGTGQQFDVSHGTEIALWPNAERLEFDFFPAIGQSPRTFVGLESTAKGRGNFWHIFTENVRMRKDGYAHWVYSFTPWYIEPKKHRRTPPSDWRPSQATTEHAELITRTSAEYAGHTIKPTMDQIYWWETEREMYRKNDSLNVFLTNYCATPEQSFQHSTRSALPIDTIEWMRTNATLGMPYMPNLSVHV